jgi:hypothetical protein
MPQNEQSEWIAALTAWSSFGMMILTFFLAIIAIFQDKIRAWVMRPILKVSIQVSPPDCHKTEYRFEPQAPSAPVTMLLAPSIDPTTEARPTGGSISGVRHAGALPPYNYTPNSVTENNKVSLENAVAYYFRLRIENTGNQTAQSVEVFASKLSRQQADGKTYKQFDSFLPMNLRWSHSGDMVFPAIAPGTYKHCDLAHIIEPNKRKRIPLEDNLWPTLASSGQPVLSFDTVMQPYTKNHLVPTGKYQLVITIAAANAKPIEKTLEINLKDKWYDEEPLMLSEGIGINII